METINTKNNPKYILKEDSGQGKSTWVLKIEDDSWQKIKHLFDAAGRPSSDLIKKIPFGNYVWDLYSQEYSISGDRVMHKIYGVCGDYTFGNAPTFYKQKLRGNKRAAKHVFEHFIKTFLND